MKILIGWRNDKLDISCPDAISIVDSKNGEGLYNWGKTRFIRGREGGFSTTELTRSLSHLSGGPGALDPCS